jgi:condensin complex subunit 3
MIPEKAALARIFTKYCVTHGDQARLDGNLPVVTALAFRIQADFNDVRERLEAERRAQNDDGEDDDAAHEDARLDREFVLGEMLQIATYLDYGDEIGRRRMFQLVSEYFVATDPHTRLIIPLDRGYDLSRVFAS